MAWNYQKRIAIFPGVQVAFGKSGVCTSIGFPGAFLTTGPLNSRPGPEEPAILENFFSCRPLSVEGHDLAGIRQLLVTAYQQRKELQQDLEQVTADLRRLWMKFTAGNLLLYGLLNRRGALQTKQELEARRAAAEAIRSRIEKSCVELEVSFEPDIKVKYDRMVAAFKNLVTSERTWDVSGGARSTGKGPRPAATTAAESRKEVRFGVRTIPLVQTGILPLWLTDAAGGNMLLYPHFAVLYAAPDHFAVIGLEELQLHFNEVRIIEEGKVPRESQIVGRAGSDEPAAAHLTYKNNRSFPVVRYGEICLKTEAGLQLVYQFSHYGFAEDFSKAYNDYRKAIFALKSTQGKPQVA
ncbi:DUF4236 domain-containing protein [Paraflavisolibacter sp. H34]|uniref:DUF4236 domain-containing protein n=1 Tax=Huijunlia imazamoxiresistens TaxID=3127457 RepID=UPI0030199672